MQDHLLYNGAFYPSAEPIITADNRGLRYGDGLFETLKVSGSRIQLMEWHFDRLFSGLKLLEFQLPAHYSISWLKDQVEKLCTKNSHPNARVRINIIRGNGGLYDPENHFPNTIIQSWPLPHADFQMNENGLVTGVYQPAKKQLDAFSHIKSNNYLPYTMAALHAKKNRWNEAFVLNTEGRICDATIANVFIIKNEKITTPPLTEGCVAGIMRRFLLSNFAYHGFEALEKAITVNDVLQADEVFTTNTIKGICWVKQFEEAVYGNRITTSIFSKLLKR